MKRPLPSSGDAILFPFLKATKKLLSLFLLMAMVSCATPHPEPESEQKQEDKLKVVTGSEKPDSPAEQEQNNQDAGQQMTGQPDQKKKQVSLSDRPDPEHNANHVTIPEESVTGLTDREATIVMEKKLDKSLGEFDEMLLNQNRELAIKNRELGGEIENDSMGGYQGGDSTVSDDVDRKLPSVSAMTGSERHVTTSETALEDIDNDDVVARQIREAAENEQDPELKKKLWIEYKKYKDQSH